MIGFETHMESLTELCGHRSARWMKRNGSRLESGNSPNGTPVRPEVEHSDHLAPPALNGQKQMLRTEPQRESAAKPLSETDTVNQTRQ